MPGDGQKRGVLVCISGDSLDERVKLRRQHNNRSGEKRHCSCRSRGSATHCQIQHMNSEYVIFDMNSSNGTHVNNDRVIKKKLSEGDVTQVGKTSFRFILEDENCSSHTDNFPPPVTTKGPTASSTP